MPAFELRRFLAEARAKNESFSLEYTRLRHYDARNILASGTHVRLDEDGQGGKKCTLVDTNEECETDEPALQPPLEPEKRLFPSAPRGAQGSPSPGRGTYMKIKCKIK